MRLMTLVVWLAFCGAVFGLTACGEDGGDEDIDTDTESDTGCVENEDCGSGYHCTESGTCDQECTIDEQCVQLHALYWICNEWGECVFDDPESDTDVDLQARNRGPARPSGSATCGCRTR